MNISLVTVNCAKTQCRIEAMQEMLETALGDSASPPDVLLVALQEASPLVDSLLVHTEEDVYIIAVERAVSAVSLALYGNVNGFPRLQPYGYARCGATYLLLFSKHLLRQPVKAELSFGYCWSSLKGAAALKFTLPNKLVVKAVSCHLPAGDGLAAIIERNSSAALLYSSLIFEDGDPFFSGKSADEHLFVLGDLNYRGVQTRSSSQSNDDDEEQLRPSQLHSELMDTFAEERQAGRVFWGLEEEPVTFGPTYKYFPGSSTQDEKRTPSWCDRILYSAPGTTVSVYDSIPQYEDSDHKPVFLRARIEPCEPVRDCCLPARLQSPPQVPFYAQHATRASNLAIGASCFLTSNPAGRVILAFVAFVVIYCLY